MKTEVILSALEAKHPGEKEYLQAVKEVLLSIEEVYNQHPEFEKAKLIKLFCTSFRFAGIINAKLFQNLLVGVAKHYRRMKFRSF